MKKSFIICFIFCSTVLIGNARGSKDNLVSFRFGHNLFIGTNGGGTNNFLGGGMSYQFAFSEKWTLGANMDYMAGNHSNFLFNLEPRFDFFIKKALKGFHVGTNMGYNISGLNGGFLAGKTVTSGLVNPVANGFNLGLNTGYMFKMSDLRFDISVGPAFWFNITNSGDHGITFKTMATLGYNF